MFDTKYVNQMSHSAPLLNDDKTVVIFSVCFVKNF